MAELSQALEEKISLSSSQSSAARSAESESPKSDSGENKKEGGGEKENVGKKKVSKPGPPKDITTGRVLALNGRPCLQCADKGLKCTFLFAGTEQDAQCAACRRQSATRPARCVRMSKDDAALMTVDIDELRKEAIRLGIKRTKNGIEGAGAHAMQLAENAAAARVRWNAVVRDHEDELQDIVYVNGEPMSRRDAGRNFALPKHPPRPDGENSAGWRDVLPTPENRSLAREEADVEDILRPRERSGAKGPEVGEDLAERDERIKFTQRVRRYQQRPAHLSEAQLQEEEDTP